MCMCNWPRDHCTTICSASNVYNFIMTDIKEFYVSDSKMWIFCCKTCKIFSFSKSAFFFRHPPPPSADVRFWLTPSCMTSFMYDPYVILIGMFTCFWPVIIGQSSACDSHPTIGMNNCCMISRWLNLIIIGWHQIVMTPQLSDDYTMVIIVLRPYP